jgi:hypothetical protein
MKTFIRTRRAPAVDLDEIEPATFCESVSRNIPSATGGPVPATTPDGPAPAPHAGGRGPRGALNILTAIAAAVINSSTATHSAVVTVIVTVAVLTAALAWSERVRRQATAKDLEDRLSR